jgi:hypothetical protein
MKFSTRHSIKYGVLFSATLMALMAANEGKAQILSPTSSSTSGSSSGSTSNSGSSSTAISGGGQGGRATSNAAATGGSATSGATTGLTFNQGNNSPVTSVQPTDVTVRSAPQVYVPSVITGNVCALGASAGASFIGTGFAVGGSWESAQCENRQRAALLHNMGYKQAAKELSCDNRETYEAMKRAGDPCLMRPDWEPKGVAQPMPTQLAPPVVTYTAPPPPAPMPPKEYPRCTAQRRDNCQS